MTRAPASLALLAFLLTALPSGLAAVIAAPGDGAGEAGDAGKSYLPPWMQQPEGAGAKPAAGDGKNTMAAEAVDPAALDAKQKAPLSKQRRHRNDALNWPGFGFFGR